MSVTRKKNLIGEKFGNYSVVEVEYSQGKYRKTICKCLCDCGNIRNVDASNLRSGASTSCGCNKLLKIRKDLTGQKFGNYTVVGIKHIEGEGRLKKIIWECKCDCGNIRNVVGSTLKNGTSKSCGCYKISQMNRFKKWHGEISGNYFSRIKNAANRRKLEFSITKEYLWDLFLFQDRKCALSGEELIFAKNYKDQINQTASIDRINSSKGYVEGNIQWVHKKVNFIKQALDDSVLIEWCRKIYEYNKNKEMKTDD